MTVQLNSEIEAYVAEKIASGSYSSSLDVIGAGIRLLQKQEKDARTLSGQAESHPADGVTVESEGEHDVSAKIAAGEKFLLELSQRYKQETIHGAPPKSTAWPPNFFEETYGSLADDPIERLPQGDYPVIDPLL